MRKLLVPLLVVLAVVLIILLSPWGPVSLALLQKSGPSDCGELPAMPALYVKGEEALKSDDAATARLCSEQGRLQARDSDEYYRFVVLDAKRYFYAMQADSFLLANKRLSQYLGRLKQMNTSQRLLQVEQEMQTGVYLIKMVGQIEEAQEHNFRALSLARQMGCCKNEELLILSNIADAYKQMGSYDNSVAYYSQAMELGDSLGMSPATRITLTVGIASAYSAMRSFEQSSKWWQMAAELEPQMTKAETFHYLNNRGNDLFLQYRYNESLNCFLRLDSLIKDDPNMLWDRMFEHCNLSGLLVKLGQTGRARPILDEAERFFTEQGQPIPLYYLTTQRIEMALMDHELQHALRLDREHPTPQWMIPEQVVLRQEVLISLYEQTGQWQLMAREMQSCQALKDSIAGDNMKMRFSETLMRYEHEKQLMAKGRQLEEEQEKFRWSLALLVGAILLILLLVSNTLLKQREAKLKHSVMQSQIASLRMETVRNRITPHFIGNALSAEMMAQAEGHEVDLDGIVELLHRGIELTGTEQSTLADELEFIAFYCDIESRSVGPDFRYEAQLAADVDASRVVLPSMSVQILVENAIKHGLKRKKAEAGRLRTVTVKASRKGPATLVEVIDNGVGLPEERSRHERTGLRVIRQTFTMLNQQNRNQVDFGMENYGDDGTVQGCRSWLLLPDDYEYKLKLS